jgi:ubiquinone/menaquinone biosynthesis C-methylase UbiE
LSAISVPRRVSELQHPDSRPFELVADLYERVRPGYPQEAVRWIAKRLDLRSGRVVLDLGAGTGKLTRALVETGAEVLAVEPGDAMRAELERVLPQVQALRGSAESIPLPDGSVDAITVGQAFHWFRFDEALPELHRLLRAGGGVALIWNGRDHDSPLQSEIKELLEPFVPSGRAVAPHTSRHLAESPLFHSFEQRTFRFVQELDADALVGRIASISFVAGSTPEKRAELERQLRALAARTGDVVEFPYVTDVYVSRAA